MYKVIDLFAGAGGLSLGFVQTGRFEIEAAFENNSDAQLTYGLNHPGTILYGDVCAADYKKINELYGPIDVVIGGPPCQGFSNANRQNNHAINQNNMLVKQYVRAILELRPKAFIMENVSMLKSQTHRFYLTKDDVKVVKKYNIDASETNLLLIEEQYKEPDFLAILKSKGSIRKYLWNDNNLHLLKKMYRARGKDKKFEELLKKHKNDILELAKQLKQPGKKNSFITINQELAYAVESYFSISNGNLEQVREAVVRELMTQQMLERAKEIFDNNLMVSKYTDEKDIVAVIKSFSVYDYLTKMLGAEEYGYIFNSDILCAADYGVPQKRYRFILMGVKKELAETVELPNPSVSKHFTVRDAIEDLEESTPFTSVDLDQEKNGIKMPSYHGKSRLLKKLRDSTRVCNHITPQTRENAMERFKHIKEGENFHSLDKSMKENTYSDSSRTQNTIYLRLRYDEPSGTVINVRKSMWIHPKKNRAISVREAARLQSFPDSFVFRGKKDSQYQQVGNAVPPMMAYAIASKVAEYLERD